MPKGNDIVSHFSGLSQEASGYGDRKMGGGMCHSCELVVGCLGSKKLGFASSLRYLFHTLPQRDAPRDQQKLW